MNTIYYYGHTDALNHYDFSKNTVWYWPYVDYAKKNGIIDNRYEQAYEIDATRADFVMIIEAALPKKCFQPIKNISDGSIPDVSIENPYYNSVYRLYRAGIISGNDANGSFNPVGHITRAEISVILGNILNLGIQQSKSNNILTLLDLENYLNHNMSSCVTPLGTYNYHFSVKKRTSDFIIETAHTNNSPWYDLQYSDSISDITKEKTLSILRDFQKEVYKIASTAFPNESIAGGFCDFGYKYPNIRKDPYVITALSWSNHSDNDEAYAFYWETSRDLYNFNSDEENTDIETDITTIEGLENYLNKTMSSCETPMGSYSLKFDVSKNNYSFHGWDIEIRTEGNYCLLPWAEINSSIEYTNQEKNETLEIFRDIQKEIYEIASQSFPDKKLTGCYFSEWYKYPSISVGYQTSRHLSWTNYSYDGYLDDYQSTYITEFHWDTNRDK